jgi:hypothetical protein
VYIVQAAAADRGQILYVDGGDHLVWLEDQGAACRKIRTVWHNDMASTCFSACPTIWNDTVYAPYVEADLINDIVAYGFNTGAALGWLGGSVCRQGVSIDTATGQLAVPTEGDGLSTKPYALYWNTQYNGLYGVNTAPAVIGNCIIFGTEHNNDAGGCAVYFFNKNSGTTLWSYTPASYRPFSSSPAASNGKVIIGSMDGCVYGFWDGVVVTTPIHIDNTVGGVKKDLALPGTWTLKAFPNPATGGNIIFAADGFDKGGATLGLYDANGRLLRTLPLTGKSIFWDTRNNSGQMLSSGTYFAVLRDAAGKKLRAFNIEISR